MRFAELVNEAYIYKTKDAIETLGRLRGAGKQLERGQQEFEGNLANYYVNDVWDVYTWLENKLGGFPANMPDKLKPIMQEIMALRGEAKKIERIWSKDLERTEDHMGAAGFGNMVVNTLYPLMQWLDMHDTELDKMNQGKGVDEDLFDKVKGFFKGDQVQGRKGKINPNQTIGQMINWPGSKSGRKDVDCNGIPKFRPGTRIYNNGYGKGCDPRDPTKRS